MSTQKSTMARAQSLKGNTMKGMKKIKDQVNKSTQDAAAKAAAASAGAMHGITAAASAATAATAATLMHTPNFLVSRPSGDRDRKRIDTEELDIGKESKSLVSALEYDGDVAEENKEEENKQGLTTLEEEVLIASLVDSEELGPAVKAVYDRGVQESFAVALGRYKVERETEIFEACGQHHALDFIRSVDAIVTVRDQLALLDGRVDDINTDLQETGKAFLEAGAQVLEVQNARDNLDVASEVLEECIGVLVLFEQAQRLLQQNRFLSALKVLKRIQGLNLKRMRAVSFGRYIEKKLPWMLEKVRESAMKEFNDFLSSLRLVSSKVGLLAMELTQERSFRQDEAKLQATKQLTITRDKSELDLRAFDPDRAAQGQREALPLGELGLDFGPIFRCLEVHNQLGEMQAFRQHYRDCRRTQAGLDNVPPKDFSKQLQGYLTRLLGFFVLEEAVSASSRGLIPRDQAEGEWRDACKLLCKALQDECEVLTMTELFLSLRTLTSLFCAAMEYYGFSTNSLREALDGTRERFLRLLQDECAKKVDKVIADETYDAMMIKNNGDLLHYMEDNVLMEFVMPAPGEERGGEGEERKIEKEKLVLPVTMMFSETVPRLLRICKSFVFDAANFYAGGSNTPLAAKEVLSSLSHFLLHVINAKIAELIDNDKLGIFQALQLSVNTTVLGRKASDLLLYISEATRGGQRGQDGSLGEGDAVFDVALRNVEDAFSRTRARAEDILFAACLRKVDEMMDIAEEGFDWYPAKKDDNPSDYILDLATWLRTTFPRFTALPAPVSAAIHYTTCKHISLRLTDMPSAPRVKRLNFDAFHKMKNDVAMLEQFADDAGVAGLRECFRPNRQLVELLTGPSLHPITDEVIRFERFGSVDLASLAQLLDKYKDHSSAFSLTRSGSRRKEVDEVLKKIKELVRE